VGVCSFRVWRQRLRPAATFARRGLLTWKLSYG